MNQQLQNFQTTVSQITGMQGNNETAAMSFLSKCLFTIGIGSNDIGVNYYGPLPLSSIEYTPDQFTALLIDQYSQQLRVSTTILTIFLIIFCIRNNSLEKLSQLFFPCLLDARYCTNMERESQPSLECHKQVAPRLQWHGTVQVLALHVWIT